MLERGMLELAPPLPGRLQKAFGYLWRWYRETSPEQARRRRAWLEALVAWIVRIEARRRGIRFPERTTGGWWWTWRWRLDLLAGWYEFSSLAWCRRLIQPGMLVLDVGAHIGYYSWHFSRWVRPGGRVIAFEPFPENYDLLLQNLRSQGCENVRAEALAITESPGEARLFIAPGNSNHSLSEGFVESQGSLLVAATSIDAYFSEGTPRPLGFMKMDIEGAEPRALQGMADTVSRHEPPAMLVELNLRALRAAGSHPSSLAAILDELGYRPFVIQPAGSLLPLAEPYPEETCNLLCLRASQPAAVRLMRLGAS